MTGTVARRDGTGSARVGSLGKPKEGEPETEGRSESTRSSLIASEPSFLAATASLAGSGRGSGGGLPPEPAARAVEIHERFLYQG
jgi:hypothetical protein